MKTVSVVGNMIGIVSRYVMASVAVIWLAEFILLLLFGVRTDKTVELETECLLRGLFCGAFAIYWFRKARKEKFKEKEDELKGVSLGE